MMKKICAVALGLMMACSGQALAGELTVSAAASLSNAMDEIKTAFGKKYPEIVIHTNYAASNPLLQQLREGAPVDVFASADQATMDKATQGELIVLESRRNFAANELVLIVPASVEAKIVQNVSDLKAVKRVAVGNPDSVPAGRYARESLQNVGMWDSLQERIVFGESVRQVLDYVAREEVDAGVVYATDAALMSDKVHVVSVLTGHTPITYPVAVAKQTTNRKEADLFVDFLSSHEGQQILQQFGFTSAMN